MREVEGERERSAPLTPNSSTRSHFDPSLSPVSQMSSSRMQQLPPHSGFSYSHSVAHAHVPTVTQGQRGRRGAPHIRRVAPAVVRIRPPHRIVG